MVPSSMRWPENQMIATVSTFITVITITGSVAMIFPTRSVTPYRSRLVASNRPRSCPSRTNARITRTPVICSRSRWLTRSRKFCMRS